MGITTENPISTDPRLKELLTDINDVKTKETYIVWRKSFLKIYETYLDPDGILNGIDSNYRLSKQLQVLNERIVRVNNLINDGKSIIIVGEGKGEEQHVNVTAEGRRGLTNLTDEVARTEKLIEEFMPKTNINEERVGYDKFELAAVLISDGFHGYDLMKETNTLLEQMISNNNNNNNNKVLLAVDDSFQKIIKNYNNSIDSFINVMEDLGIFNIMKQCVQVVYDGNERPEPKPPPPPPADDESDSNTSSDEDIDQVKGKGKDRDTTVSNSDHDNDNGSNHDSKEKKKKKKEKTSKEKSLERVRARMENRKKGNGTRSKRNDVDNKGDNGGDSNNALKKPTDATKAISRIKNDNNNKTRAATHPIGDNNGSDGEAANPGASLHQHPNEEEGKDEEEEDDEEEEEPPPEDGEGDDECEFLIYFDPKTNSIGQINREECSAKSRLIVAADNNENKKAFDNDNDEHDDKHKQVANGCYNNAKDEYQNIIEDDREKQEIIWLLKKVEKTKPVEVSWLDEIKKEKAAAKAKEEAAAGGGGGSGGGKKKDTGKKKKKRTTTKGISKRDSPTAVASSSSSSKEKKKKKSTVEDYQGKYRKEAAKPSAGGWN